MVSQCSQMSDNKNRLLVLLVVMNVELFLQLNYLKPDPESKKMFLCIARHSAKKVIFES